MDKDYLVRVLADKKTVRGLACITPKLVRKAAERHQTSALATELLGKALTLAALMGALLKVRHRVAMKWAGDGSMQKIVVEAESNGAVRGYVAVPNAQNGLGRQGYLFVTKDLHLKELYRGVVPLVSGELDEDLQFYLNQSEQIPSIIDAEVLLAEDGEVSMAAGFLVQSLPPYGEEVVQPLRERLAQMPALTHWLLNGNSLEKWLETFLADPHLELLDARELAFHCTCSSDKMAQALTTLGKEELAVLAEEGLAEVQCQFCRQQYTFTPAELQEILEGRWEIEN